MTFQPPSGNGGPPWGGGPPGAPTPPAQPFSGAPAPAVNAPGAPPQAQPQAFAPTLAWTPPPGSLPGAVPPQSPQQPQPQAWGQPGGAPQPQAWGPPGTPAFGAPAQAGPVPSVGLFGKIPCPHCGQPMSTATKHGAGRYGGGLVGVLLAKAIGGAYQCSSHGDIPLEQLPPAHRNMVRMRKLALIMGAVALIVAVVVFVAALNSDE